MAESLLKELGTEKYLELVFKFYGDKVKNLTAEIAQTEKQLKKLKRELRKSEETIETFERLKSDWLKEGDLCDRL